MNHESSKQKLEEIWGHFPTPREARIGIIEAALRGADGKQGVAATMLKRQTLSMRLKALNMRQ